MLGIFPTACFPCLSTRAIWPGPSRLLVTALGAIGWTYVGDGIFIDATGRVFHLCLSPLQHVHALLLSTWTEKVAAQVRHRKYLSDLENVCVPLSQVTKHLLPFEKALVLQQQVGALFSGEFTKHIDTQAACCVHCGMLDSRVHRLRECPRTATWRAVFPALMQQWDTLPDYTTAFGLVSEPEGWREWQAWLDTFSLPVISRSDSTDIQVFYTDGACLFPRHAIVRVASGAVLKAIQSPSGRNVPGHLAWNPPGVLPNHLSCGATGDFVRSSICQEICDPHGFPVRLSHCHQDLGATQGGPFPVLPTDNRDLWAYFLSVARGTELEFVRVWWIKGHVNYRAAAGMCRIHAAKEALGGHFTPLFQHVVKDFRCKLVMAKDLFSFQAGVALLFANDRDAPIARQPVAIESVCLVGLRSTLSFEDDIHPLDSHQGFAKFPS